MKKIGLLITIALIAITSFSACVKKIQATWVYFDETGLNTWGAYKKDGTQDEKITEAVKKNLEEKNTSIIEIKIENDGLLPGQMACTAANCKTGRRIHCKVKKEDVSVMLENGFYE